jgi:hypothetical protein
MSFPIVSSSQLPGIGEYQIPASLRFRSGSPAYISYTPTIAGDRTKWSVSCWTKLSLLSSFNSIISAAQNTTSSEYICIDSSGFLKFYAATTATTLFQSNAIFRDTSAWLHITLVYDSTNATAGNRVVTYINGSQISGTVNVSLNRNSNINSNILSGIGAAMLTSGPAASTYFDGYLAEVNFVDGLVLTPAAFGNFDFNGNWKAKKYTGSYGANGFYLNFSNTTTLSTLVADTSGNNKTLTPNGFSLAALTPTYDAMIDTPLGGGGSERGNYATLNPLNELPLNGGGANLTNGNLTISNGNGGTSTGSYYCSTLAMPSGKFYCELHTTSTGTANLNFGIVPSRLARGYVGTISCILAIYGSVAQNSISVNGTTTQSNLGFASNSDIYGIAFDADARTLQFYRNGTAYGTQITGLVADEYVFTVYSSKDSGGVVSAGSINFGQRPFTYVPPTGFKPLHTGNLSNPTITNPKTQFDIVTRQGVGGVGGTVSSLLFAPGMLWDATRSRVGDKDIHDSLRGAPKYVLSNIPGAEVNGTVYNFTSNGYTISSNDWPTSDAVVEWIWKAGTTVTNTNGSVTSQVNANPSAGFSMVYVTLSNVNSTVGHGLGIAPKFIFGKRTDGVSNWPTYHESIGSDKSVYLNLPNAQATDTTIWQGVTPTSSVFSTGTGIGATRIFYCFAEIPGYSKISSYTGNGSADGPFVFCGFRPRWIMIKRTDASSATGWYIYDTARDTYNYHRAGLAANSTSAEFVLNEGSGGAALDTTSNGFKIRGTYTDVNASGGTHIFIAIAESPFKYSLAR